MGELLEVKLGELRQAIEQQMSVPKADHCPGLIGIINTIWLFHVISHMV